MSTSQWPAHYQRQYDRLIKKRTALYRKWDRAVHAPRFDSLHYWMTGEVARLMRETDMPDDLAELRAEVAAMEICINETD